MISLLGTVEIKGDGAVFTVSETERLEQRRGAFRLTVACPVHVIRSGGARLDYRTADLSLTGLRILDADELISGEELRLEIQLGEQGAVEVRGARRAPRRAERRRRVPRRPARRGHAAGQLHLGDPASPPALRPTDLAFAARWTASPAVTRSQLAADLRRLGVREGGVLMVHTRMSALGWVAGAAETVVHALLDALGPDGTLMAYASWEEHVYHATDWPAERREAYLAEPPVFDLAISEADRENGRVPERIRTWPGAHRSFHPEASVVAIGARAAWLTADHPQDEGYGAASPFARLGEAGGQVLMLGAPLETLTILHHAEGIADVPDKLTVTFRVLVAEDGVVSEREYTDIDTSQGAVPYDRLGLGGTDEFEVIGARGARRGHGHARARRGRRLPPVRRRGADRVRRRVDRGALRLERPGARRRPPRATLPRERGAVPDADQVGLAVERLDAVERLAASRRCRR